MVEVGDEAPDFELRDSSGQPVRLSDFRGKRNVTMVFYPFAFSRTCRGELCELRDSIGDYSNDDSELLAISVDSTFTLRAWAADQGYGFPLLADFWPHGAVAQAYGVFDERAGCALRGSFVVDREGIVRYAAVNGISDARDPAEVREVLAAL